MSNFDFSKFSGFSLVFSNLNFSKLSGFSLGLSSLNFSKFGLVRKEDDMAKVDLMGLMPKVVKDLEAVNVSVGSIVVVLSFSSLMNMTLSLLDDFSSTIGELLLLTISSHSDFGN